MNIKTFYIILLLICLIGCSKGKNQKAEAFNQTEPEDTTEQELKLDSVAEEKQLIEKDSSTEFFKLPNFDEYFEIVWEMELQENPNQNDYIIIDSIILSPDLIRQRKGINIRSGELISTLDHPIEDSLFRINNNPGQSLFNINKKEPLIESKWHYGISQKPEEIQDSLILFKVWTNKVALYNINNKKPVWTIDSLESRIIRTFVLDSVVVIYMKDETIIVDKFDGDIKWSDDGKYYFINGLVSKNQMILINENEEQMVKVNPNSGDIISTHRFSKKLRRHLLEVETFYFTDDSTLISFDLKKWQVNWSKKGKYLRIKSDDQFLYTFNEGKLQKIDKNSGELNWETFDSDYGGQIIPSLTYVITEIGGMQEGGCLIVIDKYTGEPLALHCDNFYYDDDKNMLSKINIYLYGTTPVHKDMLLVANQIYPRTTYMLIKKSR